MLVNQRKQDFFKLLSKNPNKKNMEGEKGVEPKMIY